MLDFVVFKAQPSPPVKTNPAKAEKILFALSDVERAHTATPFVSAVFAAFVLYLAHETPEETELGKILDANHVSPSLRHAILDRLGDHWKEYLPLLTSFMQSELADCIRTAVDGEKIFDGRASGCASSLPIVELAVRLLDLKPGDSVCDLGCSVGDFLHRAYSATLTEADAPRLLGSDICADAAAIAEIRMFCDGAKVEIRNESVFSPANLQRRFDKVFCDPPLGVRGLPQDPEVRDFIRESFPDFPELVPSMTGDWIFAARAAAAMRPGGRAVVVLLPSALSDGRGEAFRRFFIRRKLVEAVIELPAKLLSHTAVPVCMLVLGEGNESVKMVRAEDLAYSNRRKNVIGKSHVETIAACLGLAPSFDPKGLDRYRVTVANHVLLKGDCCLAPKRHFAPPVAIRDAIGLGEFLASAKRGAAIASRDLDSLACEEETSFLYISTGDIADGVLAAKLVNLRDIPPAWRPYCAQNGDIVVSRVLASGAGFKSAVVETPPGKTVLPNGNLWVVTVDPEKADPYFVKACLDSDYGQRFLANSSSGTAILTFGYRTLEEFPIPALPLDRQREIGQICREKALRFAELRDRLAAAKADLSRVFADHAADCLVPND